MAELIVVSNVKTDRVNTAVSGFQDRGHVVNTLEFHEEFLAIQERRENPDLLLVDQDIKDARRIFDSIQRRAGDFPVVIPAADGTGAAEDRDGSSLDVEAVYVPIKCDLDVTLKLIRSVLTVWHDS